MKQYCRHCAFCIDSEPFYCTNKEQLMSEAQIRRANTCSDFALADEDIISGKPYNPRRKYDRRTAEPEEINQLSLWEENEND